MLGFRYESFANPPPQLPLAQNHRSDPKPSQIICAECLEAEVTSEHVIRQPLTVN